MFVETILPHARERLAVVAVNSFVWEAVKLMAKPHTDLVVVCEDAVMVGVVTKTDILAKLSRCDFGHSLDVRLDTIMTREVTSCRPTDPLFDLWIMMNKLDIRSVPVIDLGNRPMGIIYGREVLQALLQESQIEDGFLRNYIMGVGYQ
jgi:CBS domain-containing protein